MINALLTGIFNLIIGLVSVLLAPIDAIISSALPDLSNAFAAVGGLFSIANQGVGFAISVTGLSSASLQLIVLYWTFKLTAPMLVSAIKTAIQWYNTIKP